MPLTEQAAPEATGDLPVAENPLLVGKITQVLRDLGHPTPEFWEAQVHPHAHSVADDGIQRFLINRYWRETLGALDDDTINARYCLIEPKECSVEDWLRSFREGVAPAVVKLQVGVLH